MFTFLGYVYCGTTRDAVEAQQILPFIANVTATPTTDPVEIRQYLIEQVCGQVRWRESVEYMAAQGIELTVEAGAGKVLSVMNRRTAKEIEGLTLGTPEDIESVASRLR